MHYRSVHGLEPENRPSSRSAAFIRARSQARGLNEHVFDRRGAQPASRSVKRSTDGGDSWLRNDSLSRWLSERGAITTPACRIDCGYWKDELSSIEFVPGEPGTRFALGEAGVFYTLDGVSAGTKDEHWHRLLEAGALACLPRTSYFDRARRELYVGCLGRSVLQLRNIPAADATARKIQRPIRYQPALISRPPKYPRPRPTKPELPPQTGPAATVSITLECPHAVQPSASAVAVAGTVQPARRIELLVEWVSPQGQSRFRATTTDGGGRFSAALDQAFPGTWSVQAHWHGDLDLDAARSTRCDMDVSR